MNSYLEIGRQLAEHHTWGAGVVERLARDLRAESPEMSGFSRTNLSCRKQVFAVCLAQIERLLLELGVGFAFVAATRLQSSSSSARRCRASAWSQVTPNGAPPEVKPAM